MRPLAVTALTAISALGQGAAAHREALAARRGGLRPALSVGLQSAGHVGRIDAADDHPGLSGGLDCRNNRLADLALHTDGFAAQVALARNRYGADRIAVVVGTSTSGILSTEQAFSARDPATGALPTSFDYAGTHDLYSLARHVRDALGLRGPALTVSIACASSARSFLDAAHLMECGLCDAAIVGGADSLCRMTLAGFAALELISPEPCRPCDAARAGISIGEAAGFALVERTGETRQRGGVGLALLGAGASSDSYHMSSPDPTGAGAVCAMVEALETANLDPDAIDYINLHGTGTRANDAMEDVAVAKLFGRTTPCSSTKGFTGHTLGASGILEALIASLCIEHGFLPGCLGVGELDPTFSARVLTDNAAAPVRHVVSNAFGFGGVNCSLLFGLAAR